MAGAENPYVPGSASSLGICQDRAKLPKGLGAAQGGSCRSVLHEGCGTDSTGAVVLLVSWTQQSFRDEVPEGQVAPGLARRLVTLIA